MIAKFIAEVIRDLPEDAFSRSTRQQLAEEFAAALKKGTSDFNRNLFMQICNVPY